MVVEISSSSSVALRLEKRLHVLGFWVASGRNSFALSPDSLPKRGKILCFFSFSFFLFFFCLFWGFLRLISLKFVTPANAVDLFLNRPK